MADSIHIGDLPAVFTVGGVSIYVLGLIGLAIPIDRVFTHDLTTAWYAATLAPKTAVAGQGVRIWVRWPILFTVFWLILALMRATLGLSEMALWYIVGLVQPCEVLDGLSNAGIDVGHCIFFSG